MYISRFSISLKLLASRWREVKFLGYLRTLSLKLHKAKSKVFHSLPCLDWRLKAPKLNRAETGKLQFRS